MNAAYACAPPTSSLACSPPGRMNTQRSVPSMVDDPITVACSLGSLQDWTVPTSLAPCGTNWAAGPSCMVLNSITSRSWSTCGRRVVSTADDGSVGGVQWVAPRRSARVLAGACGPLFSLPTHAPTTHPPSYSGPPPCLQLRVVALQQLPRQAARAVCAHQKIIQVAGGAATAGRGSGSAGASLARAEPSDAVSYVDHAQLLRARHGRRSVGGWCVGGVQVVRSGSGRRRQQATQQLAGCQAPYSILACEKWNCTLSGCRARHCATSAPASTPRLATRMRPLINVLRPSAGPPRSLRCSAVITPNGEAGQGVMYGRRGAAAAARQLGKQGRTHIQARPRPASCMNPSRHLTCASA